MFDDEKIRLIQALPEADSIIVIWIRLLALAGKTNDDGQIYINENMPYTDEMLATLFQKPLNTIRLALQTLNKFGMIKTFKSGVIFINNWGRHQNLDGMEKIKEQNRQRNKRYRENKKIGIAEKAKSDVSVTSRDGTDIELDKELDKEKEINTKSIKPGSKPKPDNTSAYKLIIDNLNKQADTNYRSSSKETQRLIDARINNGFSTADFITVIHKKTLEWRYSDMEKYLRPKTLFGTNFESYLNQPEEAFRKQSGGQRGQPKQEIATDWDQPTQEPSSTNYSKQTLDEMLAKLKREQKPND